MAQIIRVIAAWLGDTVAAVEWHELTYAHTQAVRVRLAANYAPASANKGLAAIKGVLHEAFRLGLMSADRYQRAVDIEPVRGVRLLRGRALSKGEIDALFAACDMQTNQGCRNAALLALCIGCALRRSEAVGLSVDQFDRHGNSIVVIGKGNRQRSIPLSVGCASALATWLARRGTVPGPLLLPVDKADQIQPRKLSPEAVFVILRRLARTAGVAPFAPHDCRRTAITFLLRAGVDLVTTAAISGHANISNCARYSRLGEDAKARAVELLQIPVTASLSATNQS